jgi:cytochrome c oxidase subunit 2
MLNRSNICRMLILLGALTMAQTVMAATGADPWQMNMFKGVTPLSRDMYYLHMVAMLICCVIGVVVFGVMFYSLIHHRKSKGYKAASFHENLRLEIVWTIIPFLILAGLAVPATRVLMRMDDTAESEITIKVVGSQWKWQYQYLDQGIRFYSRLSTPFAEIHNQVPKSQWYLLDVDKPLVLPVNQKVRFLVTSTDVVHSWWVPELGVKRDAIPGFMHEAWAKIKKPGVYRGQCTELCGINHGFMPIVVKAVSQADFKQWVAAQPIVEGTATTGEWVRSLKSELPSVAPNMTHVELMRRGKDRYLEVCAVCHRADGLGLPPMFPALKGSSLSVGRPVSRHIDIILKGVPGTAMQAFSDQLSDEDIAAIVTYERNAWGNDTGDTVQPADVDAIRQDDMHPPIMVQKAQSGGLR